MEGYEIKSWILWPRNKDDFSFKFRGIFFASFCRMNLIFFLREISKHITKELYLRQWTVSKKSIQQFLGFIADIPCNSLFFVGLLHWQGPLKKVVTRYMKYDGSGDTAGIAQRLAAITEAQPQGSCSVGSTFKVLAWGPMRRHWIGLRENLQETMVFTLFIIGVSCKFSLKPTQWIMRHKLQDSLEIFGGHWTEASMFFYTSHHG